MWETIKLNYLAISNYGVILALIGCGIVTSCNQDAEISRLQTELQSQQNTRPLIDIEKPVQQFLSQIAQVNQAKPKQVDSRPVPEAVTMAMYKRDQEMEQMRKLISGLAHQVQTMQFRSAGKTPPVDRSGNTEEALNDIYADVNPPELPDPMVKALARNPGSRIVADPDTGEYIPEVTAWRETSWGGGKQLHLMRHRGKLRGQTVLYRSRIKQQEQQQQPAKEEEPAFNLNLGNN